MCIGRTSHTRVSLGSTLQQCLCVQGSEEAESQSSLLFHAVGSTTRRRKRSQQLRWQQPQQQKKHKLTVAAAPSPGSLPRPDPSPGAGTWSSSGYGWVGEIRGQDRMRELVDGHTHTLHMPLPNSTNQNCELSNNSGNNRVSVCLSGRLCVSEWMCEWCSQMKCFISVILKKP